MAPDLAWYMTMLLVFLTVIGAVYTHRIHDYLGGNAVVPEAGQTWEITKEGVNKI